MDAKELEQIVAIVTEQVMSAVKACPQIDAASEGKSKVLLLAKPGTAVPEDLLEDAVPFGLEDYECSRNILRYDRVVVADLSIDQLCDVAQGRKGDPVACAIIYALLNGVDVVLLESGLEYKKFQGKANAALYGLYESYARTLQIFGIKMHTVKKTVVLKEAKPAKFVAPKIVVPKGNGQPNSSRLVTEIEAINLIKQGSPVHLSADAIVTPSAKDAFAAAGVEVFKDR